MRTNQPIPDWTKDSEDLGKVTGFSGLIVCHGRTYTYTEADAQNWIGKPIVFTRNGVDEIVGTVTDARITSRGIEMSGTYASH